MGKYRDQWAKAAHEYTEAYKQLAGKEVEIRELKNYLSDLDDKKRRLWVKAVKESRLHDPDYMDE